MSDYLISAAVAENTSDGCGNGCKGYLRDHFTQLKSTMAPSPENLQIVHHQIRREDTD